MTHSNIDLIRDIKYKHSNTEEQGSTHSFHNFMRSISYATQSISDKIHSFKQTIGNTSSNSFTHSFTYSYSRKNYSFSGLSSSNIKHVYLGLTFSNLGTQSFSFNNSLGTYSHKFLTKVTNSIKKIDINPFANIVSNINSVSLDEAKKLIEKKKVTVNGILVTDVNYQLTSLDIVRIGFEGHFLNNPNGIAIIK